MKSKKKDCFIVNLLNLTVFINKDPLLSNIYIQYVSKQVQLFPQLAIE